MKMKRLTSLLISAAMLITSAALPAVSSAAEHVAGEHDFGDPFAPYVDTKLVLKDQIKEPTTLTHTSKDVTGSPAVTSEIIESSAQFYTRDNGDSGLADGSLTDTVDVRQYGNIKNIMFAYMFEPAAEGKYPAILFLHGGGGTADTLRTRAMDFAAKGYVTMTIDIPSLTGALPKITVGGEEVVRSSGNYGGSDKFRLQVTEDRGGAKSSNLVDAEVGVIQAFNYLASNPKVDAENVGMMGSSWGGYSTTLVAGILGDKVKAAYSQYGSGFYGPTPDGTEYDTYWTDSKDFPDDQFAIEEWYLYLDPSSHLDNLSANYYMDAAAKDTFFRPRSVEATLDKALSSPTHKNVNHVWSYNASHESVSGSDTLYNYMDYYLKGEGKPISETKIVKSELLPDGSNKVYVEVTEQTPRSVQLVYSKNDTGYTTRLWNTIPMTEENGQYTAVLDAATVAQGIDYYALTRDEGTAGYSSSRMKKGFNQKVDVTGTPKFTLGGKSSNILGKGEFKAVVPVVNNDYSASSDVKVMLALYKNGVLEKMSFSDETSLEAGENKEIPVSVNIDADDVSAYTVKVLTWDSVSGMQAYSRTYKIGATDQAPTAPKNLEVASSTIDGIELTWDAAEDNIAVEGYNVYRMSDDEYEKIDELPGNSLSYTDTMIEVNSEYQYAVSAYDASGNESEKAEVSADSVAGAKLVFDAFESDGKTVLGDKVKATLMTREGSPVTIEAHKPLQDSRTMNCLAVDNAKGGTYIHLNVDDDYINADLDSKVAVMVTFDEYGFDYMRMQYNSSDTTTEYKDNKQVTLYKKLNEQRWMTKSYIIEDAAFGNKGGFDLRLNFDGESLNYIRMIQIVNLSEDFAQTSAGAESIQLAWKTVEGADSYNIYRDGALVKTVDAPARTFEDTGLEIDTEYQYELIANIDGNGHTVAAINASTLKKFVAEADFTNNTSSYMRATTTGFDEEEVSGVKAIVTESNSTSLRFAVDTEGVTGKKDRLLTIKYNDCGNKLSMRVSMVNDTIDRAHWFNTTGSGKWETATVLIPDAQFTNNADKDIRINSAENAKYAISNVTLSDCPSREVGAYYLNGIASGVAVNDEGLLNKSLTSFIMGSDKTSVVVDAEEKVFKLESTDIGATNEKRAHIKLVPDYRFLGQTYGSAVLPGADGYDTKPAAVRPVTVKITYLKNNTKGMIYVKGAKYDEENNKIVNTDNDASLPLTGTGEWVTAKVHIDDYFVQGTSASTNSPIELVFSGVPADEDIVIGKIEVTNRDYSTKLGEYDFNNPDNAAVLTMSCDDGVDIDESNGKTAAIISESGKSLKFAVDKNTAAGQKDRMVTITYHDNGYAGVPIRVSMINTDIDGAHYFYTRGTNHWETATVLIPNASFTGGENDIQIRLVRNDETIAVSKVELHDGSEYTDRTENTGANGVTGITSGIVNYNGMFNSSLATWRTDANTSIETVLSGGESVLKISPTGSRAEFDICPDYRYLGLTAVSGDVPNGTVTPITVRVTYYKGDGLMYVKGAKLDEANSKIVNNDNDGVITFSRNTDDESKNMRVTNVDGDWITAEVDIDNFFMNGGSDKFNSYVKFVTNNTPNGVIIKSIQIVNKQAE